MGFLDSLKMLGKSIVSSKEEKSAWTIQFFQISSEHPDWSRDQIIELMQTEEATKLRREFVKNHSPAEIEAITSKLRTAIETSGEKREYYAEHNNQVETEKINQRIKEDLDQYFEEERKSVATYEDDLVIFFARAACFILEHTRESEGFLARFLEVYALEELKESITKLNINQKNKLVLEILVYDMFNYNFSFQMLGLSDNLLDKYHEQVYKFISDYDYVMQIIKNTFFGELSEYNDKLLITKDALLKSFEESLIRVRYAEYHRALTNQGNLSISVAAVIWEQAIKKGGLSHPFGNKEVIQYAIRVANNMFRESVEQEHCGAFVIGHSLSAFRAVEEHVNKLREVQG